MTTTFYATRDEARRIAKTVNGKLVDAGSTAPKGSRWGVAVETVTPVHEVQEVQDTVTSALKEAMKRKDMELVLELNKPKTVSRKEHSTMKDRKGNRIQVLTKRSIPVL